MESTVKQRLIEYLDDNEIPKSQFCKKIGVSAAYITSISVSIQPDKLKSIVENYPTWNIAYLLTGIGSMYLVDSLSADSFREIISAKDVIIEDKKTIINMQKKMMSDADKQIEKLEKQVKDLTEQLSDSQAREEALLSQKNELTSGRAHAKSKDKGAA